MSDEPRKQPAPSEDTPFQRFERFAKALFRVDKRDVPKHEPKRRTPKTAERQRQ